MTTTSNPTIPSGEGDVLTVSTATATATAPAAKLRYAAPRLRRLGSVRELTLGATMGLVTDGMGGLRGM